MTRRAHLLVLLVAAIFGIASAQDRPTQLPIDLPKDAQVNFEVDAPASELVPFIALLLSGQAADPTSAGPKTIEVKTGLGTINIDTKDLADLLRPIKELHLVSYTGAAKDSAIAHYEQEFSERGMRRVASVGGSSSVLVMRENGSSGRYLAVMEQGKRVTVVRTDGMPDLGTLGQFAIEKLAEAGQRVKHKLKA
jgi:hypothetical protein